MCRLLLVNIHVCVLLLCSALAPTRLRGESLASHSGAGITHRSASVACRKTPAVVTLTTSPFVGTNFPQYDMNLNDKLRSRPKKL